MDFKKEEEKEELNVPIEPIDGQIGFEELYLPEIIVDDEPEYIEPIKNQISFDDYSVNLNKQLNSDPEQENNFDDYEGIAEQEKIKQDRLKKAYFDSRGKLKPIFIDDDTKKEKEPEFKLSPKEEQIKVNEESEEYNEDGPTLDELIGQELLKNEKEQPDLKNDSPPEINAEEQSEEDEIYENTLDVVVVKEKKINLKQVYKNNKKREEKLDNNEENKNLIEEDNKAEVLDTETANDSSVNRKTDIIDESIVAEEEAAVIVGDDEDEESSNRQEKIVSADSGEDVTDDGMLSKSLDTVIHESMIPYAEHVILDRALPRVEDGLKPVQRRILFSMLELGVTPDKAHRKSARIVGDCMGKYHPHGDSSVYDAMVRMAQPYNTNCLLVDGHGNFGSIDGDGPAAMRYTEARLAPLAMELLRDLDKDTVKWSFNFDDTMKEPDVLPGKFPNLLVNGCAGIAVGLATSIPPHNLAEVIDGVIAYIEHPSIKLKEMMKIIKAPDFPTGGYILSDSEIEQAYATGRGKIIMRAKMHIETNGADKRSIVITEIPYQTNKASILQRIASLREEGKANFNGIAEIRDESDRKGIRAVIKLKKDTDIKKMCESLFKYTNLQTTFGINMVAIANGKPKQMNLLEIIDYYVNHQRDVIFRRSKFELEQAKEREHILSGLLIAIQNIDAVVKIIKTSPNTTTAKQRLREKFALSERQAQAILDMRLARLTSLEVTKLEEEIKQLRELIKKLTAIISSKKLQFDIVKGELNQVKRQHKTDRKTRLMKSEANFHIPSDQDKKQLQEVVIAYNAVGNIKLISRRQFNASGREFKEGSTLAEVHTVLTASNTERTALIFTNKGNCYKVPVEKIPESRLKDKGTPMKAIIKDIDSEEKIVNIFSIDEQLPKGNLIFLTKLGMIKKTAFSEYGLLKSSFQAMKLSDKDEIITIVHEEEVSTFLFVTKDGMVLNAEKSDVPLQGRISGGVKGINLNSGDYCVCAKQISDEGEVVVMTDKGNVKRIVTSQIDIMARYRKGVKIITFEKETGKVLVYADYVKSPYYVVAQDKEETLYARYTDVVAVESRQGKGRPIDKLKKTTVIVAGYSYLTEA